MSDYRSKLDPSRHFPEMGEDGLIRYYDIFTGDVVMVLGQDAVVSKLPVEVEERVRSDGTKYLSHVQAQAIDTGLVGRGVPYTELIGELVCVQVACGRDLLDISKDPGMPSYATFVRWMRHVPDFKERIEQAYADRADYYANRALKEAEEAIPTVPGVAKAKLIVDTLWRSAEVGNARKYSPKMRVDGKVEHAMQIVIETGIRRSTDEKYIVDETAKIRDAQKVLPTPDSSAAKVESGKSQEIEQTVKVTVPDSVREGQK